MPAIESHVDTDCHLCEESIPKPDVSDDVDFSYVATYLQVSPEDRVKDVLYVSDITPYLALLSTRNDKEPYVDIAEVMGGEGRTTQVLIRRNFKGGRNFDCVVGVDLMAG